MCFERLSNDGRPKFIHVVCIYLPLKMWFLFNRSFGNLLIQLVGAVVVLTKCELVKIRNLRQIKKILFNTISRLSMPYLSLKYFETIDFITELSEQALIGFEVFHVLFSFSKSQR